MFYFLVLGRGCFQLSLLDPSVMEKYNFPVQFLLSAAKKLFSKSYNGLFKVLYSFGLPCGMKWVTQEVILFSGRKSKEHLGSKLYLRSQVPIRLTIKSSLEMNNVMYFNVGGELIY